jgi:hypothetical protein
MTQPEQPAQIDRDYVRLLMVMRRFIREEFAIRVQISDPTAAEKLLHYAGQSTNVVLQEMGKELRELLSPAGNDEPGISEVNVHYYRGIARQVAAESACRNKEAPQEAAKTRIYRGQRVAG